jgi:hypothetical protein
MKYMKYVIVVLFILLAILLGFGIRDYLSLRRAQIISARELFLANSLKKHGPLPTSDTSAIRPWMTFDYVNRLFDLSPDYLKATLSVTDPSYPQLSISGYAKYDHENVNTLLTNVQEAVQGYSTSTSI